MKIEIFCISDYPDNAFNSWHSYIVNTPWYMHLKGNSQIKEESGKTSQYWILDFTSKYYPKIKLKALHVQHTKKPAWWGNLFSRTILIVSSI